MNLWNAGCLPTMLLGSCMEHGWLKWCFVSFQTQFLRFPWRGSPSLYEQNCRDKPLGLRYSINCSSLCSSHFFPGCAGWNHLQVGMSWHLKYLGWWYRNMALISLFPYIFECLSINKNLANTTCRHGEHWALNHSWYSRVNPEPIRFLFLKWCFQSSPGESCTDNGGLCIKTRQQ